MQCTITLKMHTVFVKTKLKKRTSLATSPAERNGESLWLLSSDQHVGIQASSAKTKGTSNSKPRQLWTPNKCRGEDEEEVAMSGGGSGRSAAVSPLAAAPRPNTSVHGAASQHGPRF